MQDVSIIILQSAIQKNPQNSFLIEMNPIFFIIQMKYTSMFGSIFQIKKNKML